PRVFPYRPFTEVVPVLIPVPCFFFSSRRRHTRFSRDWSSDVCSSDLVAIGYLGARRALREATAEIRDLQRRLVTAEAVIRAAEGAGYLQTTTSGRHRAASPEEGSDV